MGVQESYLNLVEPAMRGDEKALRQLAERIQAPLRSYVLRIAFREDITEDIVQETLLEMFKIFKQLKEAENFWPWLCKIALNKTRGYSRTQSRHQQLLKDHAAEMGDRSSNPDGLAAVIQEEFKQCVFQAMAVLSERQKAVLSMRCYENMSYAQIAEVMGMSQLGCRLLFVRARKKLQRKLFSLGYGHKSLLLALALFGKLTAPSEAAAAQIYITPALLSAGGAATGIALVTGKTALTLAAGGAIAAGAAIMTSRSVDFRTREPAVTASSLAAAGIQPANSRAHINEAYFFFPQGKRGPVLSRLMIHDGDRMIQVLQNDTGNYFYDVQKAAVTVTDYHYWKADRSVMTLPTDSPDLESFLAQMERREPQGRTIRSDSPNLFIAVPEEEQPLNSMGIKNYDAMLEERFQYNWPARTGLRDNRDALHQQGWCCFTLQGQVHGRPLTGSGGLPFVTGKAAEKPAWLKVTIAGKPALLDTPAGAVLQDGGGHQASAYPAGTFLLGLNRPWSGLHVLDVVRRDAAQFRIPFDTALDPDGVNSRVTLHLPDGEIEYRIDMEKDLIDWIRMVDAENQVTGEITFSYLISDAVGGERLRVPSLPAGGGIRKTESFYWLSALANGRLYSE